MKLSDLIERLFPRATNSRDAVKRRLKMVLAYDRIDLTPEMLEVIRREILAVLSRYVEIDIEDSEFGLESDQRATALIANLPIRRVKTAEESKEFRTSELTTSSVQVKHQSIETAQQDGAEDEEDREESLDQL
ncbi:MAG: cell division topological specificity factor MinE [Microcoleaceae cyanobacterium]